MAVSFDRIADRYDQTRGGEARGRVLADAVHPWLRAAGEPERRDRSVLEVCVGTGVVAAGLTARGLTVCGVDISPRMAAIARGRLGARVAVADACRLPIADSSVDDVVVVAALHLVGDLGAALAEAARVLRPGGRLVAIHAMPEMEPVDVVTAQQTLDPVRQARPDRADQLDLAAASAGLSLLYRGLTGPTAVSRSPRETADGIEERAWSFLWPLDEAAWQRHAVPAIAALRSLPDQERRRDYANRHHLSVYATSGAGT